MITEFLDTYTKLLVEHPEDISIEVKEIDEGYDEITILAHTKDVGQLIGKQGRMINAIKTVISGCKAKDGKRYHLNVKAISK